MLMFLIILFLLIWSIVGVCILKQMTTSKPAPESTIVFLGIIFFCGPIAWVIVIICLAIDILTKGELP